MSPNVGNVLHQWAQRDPDRPGIIDTGRDDRTLSYAELDSQASRVAAALRARGLGRGDGVAICTGNGLGFVAAWFGAVYAGCTTLPIPASSTAHEIAIRLEHAGCKAHISDTERAAVANASKQRANEIAEVLLVEQLVDTIERAPPCEVASDALAMLLYTSGTTGAAKGVSITHASLRAHTEALVEHTLGLTEHDRVLGTLPLTHSYGIRTTLLVPFFAGACTVFVPKFSPARTLELCATQDITWLPGVPTMFIAWSNVDAEHAPRSLRWCLSAGAPLPEDVRLRAEARLGAPVRQGYGLTEANLTAINAPPDEAVAGCCGKPVAGVEVLIADEAGTALPRGAHGEVLVRGQNVMSGYFGDKLATAHVMRGGWLHTGDVGFLDEAGRLTIADRSKDLILRGGASIYPSEVEDVLARHPAVRDVAVVGQEDGYYGEVVVAVVALENDVTARELDAWSRERLAPYKLPLRYAFVEALPRGPSGKMLKRRLRDQIAAGELAMETLPRHRPAQ